MKFFPEKSEELKSSKIIEEVLLNINNTEISSLTMRRSDNYFKGNIDKNYFKIISSEKPLGIFCVFEGRLVRKESETIIRLGAKFHNTFKILICIWGLLPFFMIIINFLELGVKAFSLFIPLLMTFGFLYFLINFLFKKSYENGIKDLNRIINQ
ncbi:hypothetical protein [Chryseobacterium gambrini]|uniref:hypothetical protein n=1 Tax=Chryseobacterium gambrini TaxID=373672 RepID=UPI0025B36EBA|nr:hypothetical protein [Chryseobacterium gambrini]MDN4031124.1 hypothetical protein [Chryseobacterium gambrini]